MGNFLKKISGKNLRTLKNHRDKYESWYVSTGNYVLNLLVSGKIHGGFKGRSIWQLAGEEATGKTRVWVQCMKTFLSEDEDRIGIIVNTENEDNIDDELLDLYGDRIIFIAENDIHTIETELLKLFAKIEEQNPNDNDVRTMVVIDSWGFLEYAGAMEKAESGSQKIMDLTKVRLQNSLMTKLIYKPLRANSIIFIPNHVYIPPDQYTTSIISGGKKLAYGCQGIIVLTSKKADKADRDEKMIIKIENRKARFPIKRDTIIEIPMEYHKGGLTLYGGLFDLCYGSLGAIKSPSNGWYCWADTPDIKFRKKEVEENPEKFFTPSRLIYIEKMGEPFFLLGEKDSGGGEDILDSEE